MPNFGRRRFVYPVDERLDDVNNVAIWSDRTVYFLQLRSTMHFSARKITVATLAALLAALACFEHALHEVSHASSPQTCCTDGTLPACDARSLCSHDDDSDKTEPTPDKPAPPEHDPDNCTVCRFLALPQLFEPPQEFAFAETLVCENLAEPPLSFASRIFTLAPIRGPPTNELQLPC